MNFLSNDNSLRWKSQKIVKLSDGLFRHHNRLGIPRPAVTHALKKVLLLEYHDHDAGHSKYRHVLATLLKRYWLAKMAFDCKAY